MRRWIPVILISALLAQAQTPQQEPIQRITHTKVFAFGGIGFAGQISEGENDFDFILKLPTAITIFETIYATGTPEAKSYALVGIRQVNKQRFNELFRSLRGSQEQVETEKGCIVERRSLADVVKEINSGRFDPWLTVRDRTH